MKSLKFGLLLTGLMLVISLSTQAMQRIGTRFAQPTGTFTRQAFSKLPTSTMPTNVFGRRFTSTAGTDAAETVAPKAAIQKPTGGAPKSWGQTAKTFDTHLYTGITGAGLGAAGMYYGKDQMWPPPKGITQEEFDKQRKELLAQSQAELDKTRQEAERKQKEAEAKAEAEKRAAQEEAERKQKEAEERAEKAEKALTATQKKKISDAQKAAKTAAEKADIKALEKAIEDSKLTEGGDANINSDEILAALEKGDTRWTGYITKSGGILGKKGWIPGGRETYLEGVIDKLSKADPNFNEERALNIIAKHDPGAGLRFLQKTSFKSETPQEQEFLTKTFISNISKNPKLAEAMLSKGILSNNDIQSAITLLQAEGKTAEKYPLLKNLETKADTMKNKKSEWQQVADTDFIASIQKKNPNYRRYLNLADPATVQLGIDLIKAGKGDKNILSTLERKLAEMQPTASSTIAQTPAITQAAQSTQVSVPVPKPQQAVTSKEFSTPILSINQTPAAPKNNYNSMTPGQGPIPPYPTSGKQKRF